MITIPQRPVVYTEVEMTKVFSQRLFSNLCIPSTIQAYSLCVEYMKQWFLEKFDSSFFKSVHIDGQHVFDEFRNLTKDEMLRKVKPALAIIPQIDYSFDRDKLDLPMYGLDMYMRLANHKNSFFKDKEKSVYIGITMEMISMTFNYKIKLVSRAQATDVLKYMKMAYRVGVTQGKDVSMDFHIPYKLMINLAQDSGFEVKDNLIVNIIGFLCYLNKNSQIPFLYKLRNVNGNSEFFIRVENLYVHISTPEISADDGDREGYLQTNFIVEMQSTVRFPCPKFYNYFSYKEHEELRFTEDDGTTGAYMINLAIVPNVNSKGWNQFMSTDYIDSDLSKMLVIDFNELIGDLRTVIDYTKSIFLSPELFIEVKLVNDFKEKACTINWTDMTLTTSDLMTNESSHIVFYVDLNYMNSQLTNLEKYNKDRLK